jgi:hypothetical protein
MHLKCTIANKKSRKKIFNSHFFSDKVRCVMKLFVFTVEIFTYEMESNFENY